MTVPQCRSCNADLGMTVFDLGSTALANEYPVSAEACATEERFRLCVRLCEQCWLLQLDETVSPVRLFAEYAYFSSYSDTWLSHSVRFAAAAVERWRLDDRSLVVEVASNDGYLLREFQARGVPVLGIDPAENVAEAAQESGVPTETAFFTSAYAEQLVERGIQANLLVANNVLAHVPEVNDFVAGMARVLAPEGIVSVEFPELTTMPDGAQFDQIYHEHVFYYSLLSVEPLLQRHGLRVIDVQQQSTHGGSLRVVACHQNAGHGSSAAVEAKRYQERDLSTVGRYVKFAEVAEHRAASVRAFLEEVQTMGRTVVAYGAAAKGNTLLNYCGVTTREVGFVVDRSPHKQGRFLPGSHLPIRPVDALTVERPDYILVLAWNLLDEVMGSLPEVVAWGGRFVTTMPVLAVVP